MSDETSKAPPVEGWPEESATRLEKSHALRAQGFRPYPTRYERTHRFAEIIAANHERTLEDLEAAAQKVRIAGRIMLKRGMGKASFATLDDGETRLQAYVRKDVVGDAAYARFVDLVDLGDFVGIAGTVMRTRKGELSVQAEEIEFLSKALLPPPDKWHGLEDVETRYRQRYVDLMVNPDVRRVFVSRSHIVGEMRRFLDQRGYIEVETPMMQAIAGGAAARPFVTHHNALDVDLFLRIAPELYLKRLVVGGLERVYEINRNFRNEGISSMHNPEFTMLEFYTAYFDCQDVMRITEELLAAAAARVSGDKPVMFKERPISFALPFARVTMKQAVLNGAAALGLTLDGAVVDDHQELLAWATGNALDGRRNHKNQPLTPGRYKGLSYGKLLAQLFEDLAEGAFWDPTFVVDYPTEISPLSKARPDDPMFTERFELFAAGMEIANGFSELNDPLEQRDRFLDQLRAREGGDDEAHQMDEDYVRALGYGLPPTGGCGVGVDRLAMVLTGSESIRDVILFPQMRPQGGRARAAEDPAETPSTTAT